MVHMLLAIIYLAFISLGLPDSLLGAAWPTMYPEFGVPVSYAGIISMIIAAGTIVSSLQSDRLTRLLGTGKVTAISVAMTAAALFGFSFTKSFWILCVWAVPYGLGAGSVDAALNNYVALHYKSRHMSWLHCMWGLGATVGPYLMGYALSGGQGWNIGYRYIGMIQIVLTAILIFSLPLWKGRNTGPAGTEEVEAKALSMKKILEIPGAKEVMVCFFCYCAVEQTVILWASSYLTLYKGMSADMAASFASIFFIGITVGRAVSGFITIKLNDTQMIRMGQALIAIGVFIMLLPGTSMISLVGLAFIGFGCAPIYPCIIHSTPYNFGAENSGVIIGIQMASAYVGSTFMPPLFGFLGNRIGFGIFPVYLIIFVALMICMTERTFKVTAAENVKISRGVS